MSNNLERKINRANLPQKKKEAENKLKSQINMFDRLPDNCSVCNKDFDKKSKEMAKSWIVVVRTEEKLVRLFCPECLEKVKEAL